MGEINSFIGIKQFQDLDLLLNKQRANAEIWDQKFNEIGSIHALSITHNSSPNNWVYGILVKDKIEVIKTFRKQGFYATGVHINNNIYSIFDNKIELKGVNEFMTNFVALPCGWWFNLNKI
jgi:perosamine synthetase